MRQFLSIVVTLGLLLLLNPAQAQVVNIPNKSEKHFAQKYPGANDANWTNNVVNYTCKFKWQGNEYKAYYHMDGTWDFTMMYMTEAGLPEAVKTSVKNSRIGDWKPKSCAWIENRKGKKMYRVEREKGVEEMFIFYDKSGKEVKSTIKI
jgi:hypothetical protein